MVPGLIDMVAAKVLSETQRYIRIAATDKFLKKSDQNSVEIVSKDKVPEEHRNDSSAEKPDGKLQKIVDALSNGESLEDAASGINLLLKKIAGALGISWLVRAAMNKHGDKVEKKINEKLDDQKNKEKSGV